MRAALAARRRTLGTGRILRRTKARLRRNPFSEAAHQRRDVVFLQGETD